MNQLVSVYNMHEGSTAIAVAGSYLVGQALEWWYGIQDGLVTWKRFEETFRRKYMKNIIENAWKELKTIEQRESEDIEEFSNRLNHLFKLTGIKEDDKKRSIFIVSIKSDIGFEMEKMVSADSAITYQDLVDKAMGHEFLLKKYNKNITHEYRDDKYHSIINRKDSLNDSSQHAKRKVSFNEEVVAYSSDSNSVNGSERTSGEVNSVGSSNHSLNTILSELVQEMKALKIYSVEQKELIQQQQNIINYQQRPHNHTKEII